MAAFNVKKSELPIPPSAGPLGNAPGSLIGLTLVVKGEVFSDDDVLIDGKIEGKIVVKKRVTIGKNAYIQAEIEARDVIIHGQVRGDVKAGQLVEIIAAGSLHGNITAPKVIIADGAIFEGNVDMRSREEKTKETAARPGAHPPDPTDKKR